MVKWPEAVIGKFVASEPVGVFVDNGADCESIGVSGVCRDANPQVVNDA